MPQDEERAHHENLLKIHRRNLQGLLERKAKYGFEAPMWLENQIKAEQEAIAVHEPLAPSQKVKEVAEGKEIDLTTLFIQSTQIAAEQARQSIQNKEIIEQQARDALWRLQAKEVIDEVVIRQSSAETLAQERYDQEQEVRKERQQEHDERMTGMDTAIAEIKEQVQWIMGRNGFNRGLLMALNILALAILVYLLTKGGS